MAMRPDGDGNAKFFVAMCALLLLGLLYVVFTEATEPAPERDGEPMPSIVSITAYIADPDLSDNSGSAAVFDADGNLLGVTQELGVGDMSGSEGWWTFPFSSPLDVSSYDEVRLAVFGTFEEIAYDSSGPDTFVYYDTGQVYAGVNSWPSVIYEGGELQPQWSSQTGLLSLYGTGSNDEVGGWSGKGASWRYGAGQTIFATGLLPTSIWEDVVSLVVTEALLLDDGRTSRSSRCWGRYRESGNQQANLYDDDDAQTGNLYREVE